MYPDTVAEVKPGWYPDIARPGWKRRWNGASWTRRSELRHPAPTFVWFAMMGLVLVVSVIGYAMDWIGIDGLAAPFNEDKISYVHSRTVFQAHVALTVACVVLLATLAVQLLNRPLILAFFATALDIETMLVFLHRNLMYKLADDFDVRYLLSSSLRRWDIALLVVGPLAALCSIAAAVQFRHVSARGDRPEPSVRSLANISADPRSVTSLRGTDRA